MDAALDLFDGWAPEQRVAAARRGRVGLIAHSRAYVKRGQA